MRVKILECKKDALMWYKNKVNLDFKYVKEDSQGVWVRTEDAYNTLNWIHPEECVMIL
ncbi:hypothetical protein Phi10:1_gp031 [Cellulophaga phage phi10:1]|uniref:Uncharacterized protein n=1 Tax=Cellulophaga phage phi10:1 TaxID=1327981 RepID=S0A1K5_9CAUD|nr:hypothetical protein Phi10:1_gp031 [Cellulophaga phage phi10:1]AGO48372.1 hypothetical protein Phi10:1_gp031 [Cellulophaga phage phi10:1]